MNKGLVSKLLPHFIAVIIFLVVAIIYCKPALDGKVLQQSDVIHWKGMAQNSFNYKETHGKFPLWTNSMFSGMPAYQIAMEPEVKVTPSYFYGLFSLYLPKPMNFFFLACICFYFLALVLRINPYIAIIGGLTYAYATYNPAYLAAGHDTKIMTIALIPGFIGSLILIYEKKYLWGMALTAIFTALMIGLNHMQIVYYTLIIAAFMTVGYIVYYLQRKEIRHIAISLAFAAIAGITGVLSNAVTLLTTLDASKSTIRGGTELPDKDNTKDGLSKEYAFSYSNGIAEPFNMLVPDMFGGSGKSILEKREDSKTLEALQSMPQELANNLQNATSAYWGGIAPVPPAAPNYIGAITCFLALLGFFILDNKHKWWILAACVLSIVMSWGSYFDSFNSFLLNVMPALNKFRVPSMIMIIPTFTLIMMAMLTLQRIVVFEDRVELMKRFKKGLILNAGVFVLLFLIYFSADYASATDKELLKQVTSAPAEVMQYVRQFLSALKADRQSIFMGSLVKSFFLVAAAAFIVWLYIKNTIKPVVMYILLGLIGFVDLIAVDLKYMNSDNYQDQDQYQSNFPETKADIDLKNDKSYYRVFDLREGFSTLTYGAMTSYHHNSIGGYHPAKLSIYQDLIEHQLYKVDAQGLFTNPGQSPVINMLNTKYIMFRLQGKDTNVLNTGNLGPAWFVKGIRYEKDAASVMNALSNFDAKDTAVLFEKDKSSSFSGTTDSTASITLVSNDNDVVTYRSTSNSPGFAVFSEIYYDLGWKAYIDDKEVPIIRTNYVLRGIQVPAGQHNIKFVFHPSAYYTGEKIALGAGIVVLLLLIAAIFMEVKKRRASKA